MKKYIIGLTLSIAALFFPLSIAAQQEPLDLEFGTPVSGALDNTNLTDVYVFLGGANSTISLSVSGDGVQYGVLVTNSQGSTLREVESDDAGTVAIEGVELSQTATYFVTLFLISGTGDYEMALARGSSLPDTPAQATTQPTPVPDAEATDEPAETDSAEPDTVETATWSPPSDVLLNGGMEVTLSWNAPVDLNLEVRNSVGDTLFNNSRTTPIGGEFGFDANGLCEVITENPVETASWAPGFLPTGSYEILVYYNQDCENVGATDFTITVTVNGDVQPAINGTLSPPFGNQDNVYLANFILDSEGTATVNAGGLYPDSSIQQLPAPAATLSEDATPISREVTITGTLWEAQDYETYSFEGQSGDIVSVQMDAISGSLDTLVQIVDPEGNLLDVNDDRTDVNTTNSRIPGVRLPVDGTYVIVATRYGKDLGGTEGEYELLVTGGAAQLPDTVANLNLPSGDIEAYLTWETNADLQLLVRDPVGASVFDDQPTVNSGGQLVANGNVRCEPAEGTPVSYIYWPNGLGRAGIYEVEVWFQSPCDDPRPVTFTLTIVVGGEVVAVERQTPNIGEKFVLTFDVGSDGTADAGRGGFIDRGSDVLEYGAEDALPIQLSQPVNGSITLNNDFDVYAFQGSAGQAITISMQATSQTLDTKVFLIGPGGVELTVNDDADPALVTGVEGRTTDSLISAFTLPEDGEYLIIATRYGTIYGGTIGGYRLTVSPS